MKLEDAKKVVSLSSRLEAVKNQLEVLEKTEKLQYIHVTFLVEDRVHLYSFDLELEDAFRNSLIDALKKRESAIKAEIKSYGVEL